MVQRGTVRYTAWGVSGIFCSVVVVLWGLGTLVPGWHTPRDVLAQSSETPKQVSETVMNGWRWFHVYCFRCHGIDAMGSQIAPNLRESIKVLSHDDFMKVIHDGRPAKGMQAWNALLEVSQMEDIYQYVLARSEERLKRGRPDEQ